MHFPPLTDFPLTAFLIFCHSGLVPCSRSTKCLASALKQSAGVENPQRVRKRAKRSIKALKWLRRAKKKILRTPIGVQQLVAEVRGIAELLQERQERRQAQGA